jgi:serine/threonine protein kinase
MAEDSEEERLTIEKINLLFQQYAGTYTEQEQTLGLELLDPHDISFDRFLGEGTSASVYVGNLKNREGPVAIKVLRENISGQLWEDFKKELKVMSLVRGPRIVGFYGVCIRPRFCIVLEYCDQGSLLHVLKRNDIVWDWERVFDVLRQVLQAVNDLHTHQPQIVHRDLKSLNLLVDKDWNIKVCDFGLSRQTEEGDLNTLSTLYKLRGTYGYTAPELYNKGMCTNKADVFSLGVIIWEILVRVLNGQYVRPYSDHPEYKFDFQLLVAVAKKGVRPTVPPNCPEEFKIMLSSCWNELPEKRPDCGFLLIQVNMIKGREYNKNKQKWDALLPPPGTSLSSSSTTMGSASSSSSSLPASFMSLSSGSPPVTAGSDATTNTVTTSEKDEKKKKKDKKEGKKKEKKTTKKDKKSKNE